MKKILSSPLLFPLLLLLICLFIAFKNYTPGTFLTGWDTLHPEFNFEVNFPRLIYGVWRYDQGLGDISGHSHMADLPRVVILWLFHFFLPLSFLRYSYVFLCLTIGPLGFFYLAKYLFKSPHVAFLSALTYLLNLGTIQQFYVPFEMFPTQWAFLPLIILFSLKYLSHPRKSNLLIFSFLTLLATPQAYAAHLWYPFFGLYILFLIIITNLQKIKIHLPLTLFWLTLFLNSFWLLPNLYYAFTSSQIPQDNKSNRLHSQEFLLRNRETGVISDSALIRGFYFNWESYDFSRKSSTQLMPQWRQHLENADIVLIGNLLFLLAFVGLVAAFFKKNIPLISLSPFFIISFILLTNRTPFFSFFFDFLLQFSLIQQILRFVFTKLSIFLTFSLALYLGYFLHILFLIIHHHQKRIVSFVLILSLFAYCYPAFQGYLISPIVRQIIPQSYFDLWQHLNQHPESRVFTLPLNEPSGWQYYSWGYQGSGFIWFGSSQSFFNRDSDRWSQQNEEAYREFYYSLYANNQQNFLNSLNKFNVGYILWDQSSIPTSPKNRDQITFKYEIQNLLNSLVDRQILSPPITFGSIFLYTHPSSPLVNQFTTNQFVRPPIIRGYSDSAITPYLTTFTQKDTFHPLRGLLTSTDRISTSYLTQNLLPYLDLGSTSYQLADLITPPNTNVFIRDQLVNISSLNSTQGISYILQDFPHSQSFILGIKSAYYRGIPLRLCLYNPNFNLCTFEDELTRHSGLDWDYFLIPPMDSFDGYEIHLNAISYGFQRSASAVETIKIIPFPYNDIDLSSPSVNPIIQTEPISFSETLPNKSLISTSINSSHLPYLSLLQSYHPGWIALYFDHKIPKIIPSHYLLNNWANAWQLPDNFSGTVHLLFWPQLLEFLGFGLLLGSFLWIIKHKQ